MTGDIVHVVGQGSTADENSSQETPASDAPENAGASHEPEDGSPDLSSPDRDDNESSVSTAAGGDSGSQVNVTTTPPAGALFVEGAVQGKLCTMLVDTGSAATLLSEWFVTVQLGYDLDDLLALRQNEDLVGPSGESLDIVAALEADLILQGAEIRQRVRVVRGLAYDCLIGRDVLAYIPCKISSNGEGSLSFSTGNTQNTALDILTRQKVQIPARSQMVVRAKAQRRGGERVPFVGLVSSSNSSESFVVARSVVEPDQEGFLPVCVLNPTDSPLLLRRKTKLGHLAGLQDVDVVAAVQENAAQVSSKPSASLWDKLHVDSSELSDSQVTAVRHLIQRNADVFASSSEDLGRTTLLEMEIDTGGHTPIRQMPRQMSPKQREEVAGQVEKLLRQGVIEPSCSPWSSPIVLVKKKDGTTRMCIDFRALNAVTRRDAFPLPRVDDTLDALGGAKFFSTLDLCSSYHQIPIAAKDREKTAFSTIDGHYQYTSMPFGVCNGPSLFQRLMTLTLAGLQWQMCLIYLDDIIVFGRTFDEHQARLHAVLDRLRKAGLKLKPSKCFLFCTQVDYLGHVISADGIATDKTKQQAVLEWPTPTNVKTLRAFLGFANYYRRFVQGFAQRAAPLYDLLRKNVTFKWSAAVWSSLRGTPFGFGVGTCTGVSQL